LSVKQAQTWRVDDLPYMSRICEGAVHLQARAVEPGDVADAVQHAAAPARSVLIVDDNRDCADVVAMLLEMMGYQCRTANTGQAAIEAVKRERPGVVLLDIGLPDIDGHDVARRIAAEVATPPPLIAVTGYGQARDRERSCKAGFHAHIVKPIDTDKLQSMLDALFAVNAR
jgi:CheY-like chemotaxis protein